MLYLINFTDPNDEDIQMDLIIDTEKSREEVEKIVENILENSKKLWNEDLDAYLDEILIDELSKVFKIPDYDYISFEW